MTNEQSIMIRERIEQIFPFDEERNRFYRSPAWKEIRLIISTGGWFLISRKPNIFSTPVLYNG